MVKAPQKLMSEYTGNDGRDHLIKQQSFSEEVVEFLYQELVHGRLKQGHRINELVLAKNFGISRNPVREGLKRKEERGFVITIPNRGTFVREFTLNDVDDIFSFRKEVEIFALHNSFERIVDAELQTLGKVIKNMERAADNGDARALVEEDMNFHEILVDLGGSKRAKRAFLDLFSEVRMLIALVDHTFESLHDAAYDHNPALDALKTGDIECAVEALAAHLSDAHQRLRKIYENPALDRANANFKN